MLVLEETNLNKAFKPIALKGSEETNKAKLVDTEPDEGEEETEKGVTLRDEAHVALQKAQRSLNEEEMDLKKKCDEDTAKAVAEGGVSDGVQKAMRAITAAALSRRERLDAMYQLGVSQGKKNPAIQAEPVQITDLNTGVSYTRSAHEPPVVPIRRVEAPQPTPRKEAVMKSCELHGYIHKSDAACPLCVRANPTEATPLWSR